MDDNSDVMDRNEAAIETPAPPPEKKLSELADELDFARQEHANATAILEAQKARVRETAAAEREAYRAFNEAVEARKPKRKSPTPRAAKSPDAASAEKKPPKKANPKK